MLRSQNYKDRFPLKVEDRRNAKSDMARLANLSYEMLVSVNETNKLLRDIILDLRGVPPIPMSERRHK